MSSSLAQRKAAFDADEVALLARAFEQAWQSARGSQAATVPGGEAHVRELIARRVIQLAQLGERDQTVLATDALGFLNLYTSQPVPSAATGAEPLQD